MTEWKGALGLIATLIALYSYIPYFKGIIRGTTRPHAFSWLIWGLLTAIAFAAQVSDHAGPGAWVTCFTACVCFTITACAFWRGEKHITRSDWISFLSALAAIPLWLVTQSPVWSVALITLIDALAFYPTFRKSWYKPYDEVALTYTISGIKFILSILALDTLTVTTWLYPASLVIMNLAFVALLLYRRAVLGKNVTHAA